MAWACGIDFGTSNSVAAIARPEDERAIVVCSEPSCILIVDEGAAHRLYVGEEALRRYLRVTAPARFVKSMKSLLPDTSFTTTRVFGRSYGPEHLVRPILSALKERAERATGAPVTAVTLGRPVLFSTDPEADAAAEARLAKAARLAGFEEIRFRREPEAAGWSYASRLRGESRVLVADLGGGTADFTLLLLRPGGPHEALATAGVRIGGDDFDAAIMAGRLTPLFGRGSTYESWGRQLEVPPHIYAAICRWDLIPFLKESRTRRDLRYILSGASDPEAIGRLIALIDRDLGYALFREIASAKHRLSESEAAKIAFDEEPIAISVEISRRELEGMIADKVEQLKAEAVRTIALAGLAPEDVDACFLTGGSSLVPAIGRVFHALFGAERIHAGDTFTSVAMGLALIAAAG